MIIQESAEMYLETILVLSERNGSVRAVDIANEMGYSKPTISQQMKKFREHGYVELDEGGAIVLTDAGRAIAENTYERHNVIARFFIELGVSEQTAFRDACRVEHYISPETFAAMKQRYEETK